VGPELLFAETLESGTYEDPGTGVLRSWKLPDGEAVILGDVDYERLGAKHSFFAPDGKSWLYTKDNNLYSRPLPVGAGQDSLFARLGGEVGDFNPDLDQMVVADKSGEIRIWSYSSNGVAQERVIRKPDTAPSGAHSRKSIAPVILDPSGRWLSG
jgi:hypothetical protein